MRRDKLFSEKDLFQVLFLMSNLSINKIIKKVLDFSNEAK